MSTEPLAAAGFLDVYDEALPHVYGYLVRRVGSRSIAEDLTSETFMAGVAACRAGRSELTTAWFMTVARNKLVDHWRRAGREERGLAAVAGGTDDRYEPWDVQLDVTQAHATLARLGPHHRTALTLRYLDGLPVALVARTMGRTVHATEALLVRARAAFRRAYEEGDGE